VAGPRLSDESIAEALDVNRSTVERVRIRCVEEGCKVALRPRRHETVRQTLKSELKPWLQERSLPIGVQVIARPRREDIALALALRIEAATGGWQPPHAA
jgi:hypothetical protein